MKYPVIKTGIGLLLLLAFTQKASALDCQQMEQQQTLLQCAVSRHPQMLQANGEQRVAQAGIEAANQSPNPRVEFFTEGLGGTSSRYETAYVHPMEMGGAKSARIRSGQAQVQVSEINAQLIQTQVMMQVATDLYRLRQLDEELNQLKENTNTFQSLIDQISRAQGLNPEQRVSLTAYQLALSDSKLLLNQRQLESNAILSRFQALFGLSFVLQPHQLPKRIEIWPKIKNAPINSPQAALAEAEIAQAQGALDLEEAKAWSDWEIVGKVIQEQQDGLNQSTFGLGISIPLPLYHANGGGKLQARLQLETNRELQSQKSQEAASQLLNLKLSYQQIVALWANLPNQDELDQPHEEIHQAMKRGALPAPLVIEVHRQFLGVLEQRHQLELEGIAHLIQINSLQGILQEFELP